MKKTYTTGWVVTLALLVTVPAFAQAVHPDDLDQREGVYYVKGTDTLYSGMVEDPGVIQGEAEDGVRIGTWKGWHLNGQLSWAYEYEKGKTLKRTIWHDNGAKRMEGRFVDGKPEGPFPRWDKNEQKVSEEIYQAGKLHGVRRLWDGEGNLLLEAQYEAGVQHGPSTWYYASGAKRWETHFADGQRTGTWTQWTRNGDLFMKSEWQDGVQVSRHNPHEGH